MLNASCETAKKMEFSSVFEAMFKRSLKIPGAVASAFAATTAPEQTRGRSARPARRAHRDHRPVDVVRQLVVLLDDRQRLAGKALQLAVLAGLRLPAEFLHVLVVVRDHQ